VDDLEEYVNAQWKAELNNEQLVAVKTILQHWAEQHEFDPDAQELIRTAKSVNFVRTR